MASAAESPLLLLDHVNLNVERWTPELQAFWFDALGCALDPRARVIFGKIKASGGTARDLVWANIGMQQFHMPIGEPADATQQMPNGVVGLAFSDLAALRRRFSEHGVPCEEVPADDALQPFGPALSVRSPSGVRLRLHAAPSRFAPAGADEAGIALPGGPSAGLGMPYVDFACRAGTAEGIGRFYQQTLGIPVVFGDGFCRVLVQTSQFLLFRETDAEVPAYDNHHIAIYLGRIETGDANVAFAAAYDRCRRANLVWNNPRFPNLTYDTKELAMGHGEFRVLDLADPSTGVVVYRLEHEIRSLEHPTFNCKGLLGLHEAPEPSLKAARM